MNLLAICKILQMFTSIFVVVLVLIQSKGNGLSAGLKGSFSMYRSLRGIERLVFILTIVFGVVLVVNSVAILLL
jgi:preprotein translocase subunit SecG